ncbi:hypothetical protein ACLI09_01910 [Flavobacterium sp. RHBU_24]|uniref:hypothetical protein n=1 Tax=Flavobacterium sp. RHBU_24 TaxID=3391185 RepID=UPI0039849974
MRKKKTSKCTTPSDLEFILTDINLSVWDVALLAAIFIASVTQGTKYGIRISRKRLMQLSHISSIPTYHKYLKKLQDMGYINYRPSYDPDAKSEIDLKQPS